MTNQHAHKYLYDETKVNKQQQKENRMEIETLQLLCYAKQYIGTSHNS